MSITLRQFKSSFNQVKDRVEKVRVEELTFLWFDDYYDGMLCGILEYKNQKCRFEIVTDYQQEIRPRVFAIIELSEEQIADETYWHELFEQHVGSNSISLAKDTVLHRPQSEHHLFYEPYQKRPDPHYELNIVKAWYVEE